MCAASDLSYERLKYLCTKILILQYINTVMGRISFPFSLGVGIGQIRNLMI